MTYLCQLFDQPMDSNLKPLQSKVSWWRQSAAARAAAGGAEGVIETGGHCVRGVDVEVEQRS